MRTPSLLPPLLSLLALALPSPLGFAVVPAALLVRASAPCVAGLALLALASNLSHQAIPHGAERDTSGPSAARLNGTWRQLPGEQPHLDTLAGRVSVRCSDDVRPPPPGTPVSLLARVDDTGAARVVSLAARGPPTGAWLDRWGAAAARRTGELVHPERRGLVAALVLGDRSDLPWALRRACIATGVMHLLALSGLHVSLVATGLGRILTGRALGRGRVHGAALLAFVLVAGARPPLVRALLGWVLLTYGRLSARPLTPLRRLLSVALIVLAVDPSLVDDAGTRLSFLGVAGLLAALRLPGRRVAVALAPAGAFLVTAPLCVELFGRVQPWGVLLTPLLAPLVGVVLLTGLVAIVPGPALAVLDPLTGPLLDHAARGLGLLLEWAEILLPPPLTPPPLPIPGLLGSLMVLAALLALGRTRPDHGSSV
ncbi:MAG: ComEC/Rec2 family competence protein [Planctomycetes bacterium]|nr:ComEC/Rec2 family competence protein [Planctomycetota bacterium]